MKKIVFLTGAGMSVESGFKTFRGSDGLWEDYPVEQVATHEAWESDPVLVNNFYNRLRKKLFMAKPNEGHKLIKKLEDNYDVTVITQNVDDLHESAGSTNVIHLHGELKKACSSDDAYNPEYIKGAYRRCSRRATRRESSRRKSASPLHRVLRRKRSDDRTCCKSSGDADISSSLVPRSTFIPLQAWCVTSVQAYPFT